MARLGGLFHVFRTIPNASEEKRRFDNELHEFRRRLPSPVKNSTAQNWHKAAQKNYCGERGATTCRGMQKFIKENAPAPRDTIDVRSRAPGGEICALDRLA
jgi:hypothetical protein